MLDHDREQVELEMARIQLEMKRLNTEEARLEHKKRLDDMKRELKDQKERVRSMKGKELLGAKTDDSGAKVTKSSKDTKIDDKGAKPKIKQSKSKVTSKMFSEIDLSKSDHEKLNVDDLRKNPGLQKKVQKELRKLGLTCTNLQSSSSSESGLQILPLHLIVILPRRRKSTKSIRSLV